MIRNVCVAVGFVSMMALVSVTPAAQSPGNPYPVGKAQALAPTGSTARGAQLVALGGCNDCHTPKLRDGALDTARLLSGHPQDGPMPPQVVGGASTNMLLTAWRGPWGVSLARNITPDRETGIGSWTLADFKKTIRTGVNPKGEVLMPPMPILMYQNLPDSDLDAIWNYLRSLKPVHNQVGRSTASKTVASR